MTVDVGPLLAQLGPGAAFVVVLTVWLVKNRDRVGSTLSESVTQWIDRLEKDLQNERAERRAGEARHERYRAVRETRDAEHRAWDSCILQAGGDREAMAACGPPPSLTPHPSEYSITPHPSTLGAPEEGG
jgi:hypothetical protein